MRSIVLDSYIEKMVEQFSDDMKKRRQELVEERKGIINAYLFTPVYDHFLLSIINIFWHFLDCKISMIWLWILFKIL